MKQFFELTYDEQWVFMFFHSKKQITFEIKANPNSLIDSKIWDFEPYFGNFCAATKQSMNIKNYDDKMTEMSEAVDYFLQDKLLTDSTPNSNTSHDIQITSRGKNYFELEIENGIRRILPNIDFDQTFTDEFCRKKDANGKSVMSHDISLLGIIGKLRDILTGTDTMSPLSDIIFENSDLTKNIMEFIVFLISKNNGG